MKKKVNDELLETIDFEELKRIIDEKEDPILNKVKALGDKKTNEITADDFDDFFSQIDNI